MKFLVWIAMGIVAGGTGAVASAANLFNFVGSAGLATYTTQGAGPTQVGSYFALDVGSLGPLFLPTPMNPTTLGSPGLNLDIAEPVAGAPGGGSSWITTANIEEPWLFEGNQGAHSTVGTLPVTGDRASGLLLVDMGNLRMNWHTAKGIDVGAGLDGAHGTADDLAPLTWGPDGVWGSGDEELRYSAVVASGPFAGKAYDLVLNGTIDPMPVPEPFSAVLVVTGVVGAVARCRRVKARDV